jgi:UrcA family protein
MKNIVIGLSLLIGSTGAIAQPAASPEPAPSERIYFADLNLGTAPGQAALQRRIRAAAGRVCDFGGMQELEVFSASYRCYRTAVVDGLHQMNQVLAANPGAATLAASTLIISGR